MVKQVSCDSLKLKVEKLTFITAKYLIITTMKIIKYNIIVIYFEKYLFYLYNTPCYHFIKDLQINIK